MTITESAIQTAVNSLLALGTLKESGVFPEDIFIATIYGAAQMPTEQDILTARNALQAMTSLQVAGIFPETVRLALLSLAAEAGGGSADYIPLTQKGVAGGVATLDAVSGRLPLSQLSTEVLGAVVYEGTWNASTNTPTLASGGAGVRKGTYYVVSVAGTTTLDGVGGASDPWGASDVAIFNGTAWQRIDARDAVLSVNGQTGAVTLTAANVGAQATFTSQTANQVFAAPDAVAGAPGFRALIGADLPLATQTARGAISREVAGTFNPSLVGGTATGANTYNARIGTYYLIGKICVASIYIELATKDGAMAGNATISGLPFPTASGIQSAAVSQYAGVTFTAGYTQLSARIEASGSNLLLFQGGSGVGSLVLQASAISSGFVITITAAYITA